MDFRKSSVESLVADIRLRRMSVREVTQRALANIEDLNKSLNAFCALNPVDALAQADALDARLKKGDPVGPLVGVPLGVKDLEDARGYVTTYGSQLNINNPKATEDSVQVARLRAAGCVIVGKTNTPEYGHKGVTDNLPFGFTRNPWNTEYSAGGSSGGSSAAIASGMVPLATGSDGGGSIRLPSSACGFTGFKASQGRVPLGGSSPAGAGLLAVRGPMAMRATDIALALDALTGDESTDIFGLPHPGCSLRAALDVDNRPAAVVWSPTMGFGEVDAEVLATCEAFIKRLESEGVKVIRREQIFDKDPNGQWFVLWATYRARAQEHLHGTAQWELIDPSLRAMVDYGLKVSGIEFVRALDACHTLNVDLEAALRDAPFILSPTLAGQVPKKDAGGGLLNGRESSSWVTFTPAINMTRNPAGTVNVGFRSTGMPVGLQVIGRQRDDLRVLKTLAYFESLAGLANAAPVGVKD
ncbi:MAG: amidase [Gammaproteobacteria bacterium]|nr:amidase [Gammaproteobacteria bacterium]